LVKEATTKTAVIKACFTNCAACAPVTDPADATALGTYAFTANDCSAASDGYGLASESATVKAIKACVTSCKTCAKGAAGAYLAAGGAATYTMVFADCTAAITGYGLVKESSVVTKILACANNCAACHKDAAATVFGAAECDTAADGYYLVGSAGSYTAISACNSNCSTCSASDLCTTCKTGYALLSGTKLCFLISTTYLESTYSW
jgi:hypothetical protein